VTERILSQDEVTALLKGVAAVELGAGEEPPRRRGVVQPLDLTSQERNLRGRLAGLELVVDRFARGFRASLATFLGQLPEVQVTAIELVKFAGLTGRLPRPVGLQLFRMAPLRGQGMIVVTPPLMAALLQVFCGGSPARATAIAGRDLSAIEQRVLERMGARVLADLQEAWRPVVPLQVSFVRSETNPLFAAIALGQELVLRVALDVTLPETEEARLVIVIPNGALDPIRRQLEAASREEREAPEAGWGERLRAVLAQAELEVTAELGSRRMRLDDVLRLKAGDVIPLGTGREGPVVVRVEGRPRFLGAPGVAGSFNAVRVSGRI
jgi:flagellar motor switch protein FliM